jgi:hypothetical protein
MLRSSYPKVRSATIRTARLRGSLFDAGKTQNVLVDVTDPISCADTAFWVDHTEPHEVLWQVIADKGAWPFGNLLDGCEYLCLVEPNQA